MISRLRGLVLEKNPPSVVLDIQGVGYEAQVSMQTFYSLPAIGEEALLYTHLVVREDAHLLFGFGSREERETFQALIKVSGIGAKSALGILSALTSDELATAVANEDIKRLTAAPGIGKKTAERMVLELRGKLVGTHQHDELFTPAVNSQNQDIINTLLALGYSDKEARTACKNLPEGTDISEGVRLALKNML